MRDIVLNYKTRDAKKVFAFKKDSKSRDIDPLIVREIIFRMKDVWEEAEPAN